MRASVCIASPLYELVCVPSVSDGDSTTIVTASGVVPGWHSALATHTRTHAMADGAGSAPASVGGSGRSTPGMDSAAGATPLTPDGGGVGVGEMQFGRVVPPGAPPRTMEDLVAETAADYAPCVVESLPMHPWHAHQPALHSHPSNWVWHDSCILGPRRG